MSQTLRFNGESGFIVNEVTSKSRIVVMINMAHVKIIIIKNLT